MFSNSPTTIGDEIIKLASSDFNDWIRIENIAKTGELNQLVPEHSDPNNVESVEISPLDRELEPFDWVRADFIKIDSIAEQAEAVEDYCALPFAQALATCLSPIETADGKQNASWCRQVRSLTAGC